MSGSSTVAVLGGAGFLGSRLALALHAAGWRVRVIDGLVPGTGGNLAHLPDPLPAGLSTHWQRVEHMTELPRLLDDCELVIDALGHTAHRIALAQPLLDLQLNTAAHLHVLAALRACGSRRVLLLGSRGQYGHHDGGLLTEEAPQVPADVQGIHKVAAESYYRVYAQLGACECVSLRLPNCFGPGMPFEGPDIGLVGGFIRSLLADGTIELYGHGRARALLYSEDLCQVVSALAQRPFPAFEAFNVAGTEVGLDELGELLQRLIGRGQVVRRPTPPEVAAIEVGSAAIDQSRLERWLGVVPRTPLAESLPPTIACFEEHLHAVAL